MTLIRSKEGLDQSFQYYPGTATNKEENRLSQAAVFDYLYLNLIMEFLKNLEIRFADPVTALDLSYRHIIYGTAMGRLVFYEMKEDKETVPLEYLQELIRGVSHSKDGAKIYISVGDVEGIIYYSEDLTPECSV